MDDDQDPSYTITGFVVVKVLPGLMLAVMVELAATRFGNLSVATTFFAGWVGCLLFAVALNKVTGKAA